MSKNTDLIQILSLVIIGMFIPFIGSIVISYNVDLGDFNNWLRVGKTFLYFLLIFGIELLFVILYFTITKKIATKKINNYKNK